MKKNIGIIICSVLMLVCLLGLAYEAGEKAAYRSMLKEKKEALAMVEAEIDYETNAPTSIPIGPTLRYAGEEKGWVEVEIDDEDAMYAWAFGSDWCLQTPVEHMESWNERHGDIFIAYGTDLLSEFYEKIKKAYEERDLPVKTTDLYSKVSPILNNGGVFPRGLMYLSWHVTWHKKYLKGDF